MTVGEQGREVRGSAPLPARTTSLPSATFMIALLRWGPLLLAAGTVWRFASHSCHVPAHLCHQVLNLSLSVNSLMYDTSYASMRCTLHSSSSCWAAMPMFSGKRVLVASPDTRLGNVRSGEWGGRRGRGCAHLCVGAWCRWRHTRWMCVTTFVCCPSSSSSVRFLCPLQF